MKKKILFIYPTMMLGGSTTSLLALMNSLDPEKYEIGLQLQFNGGPLINSIPEHVRLLPEAQKYKGKKGRIFGRVRMLFQGALFKAIIRGRKNKKKSPSADVINEFWAKHLSKKNNNEYDYAIGFLEGWSNYYLAHRVNAEKKYAWIHSTFTKTTDDPNSQLDWMKKVDKVVFVTDACKNEFENVLPVMKDKAITIENITDSDLIRSRADNPAEDDAFLDRFVSEGSVKIITVCRITINVKGIDRILTACRALKESGTGFLWYIVGDGPDMGRLNAMIEEYGLTDVLVAIGRRDNPYPFIKAADIMCMPSRYEGKPMVITEGQILGTVPIVTEYLSANDQIENGVDGVVVPNDDGAVINPLLKLVSNRERVVSMKEKLLSRNYGNREYISEIEKELF